MKIKSDYSNLPQWKEVNVKSSLPKELDCLNELAHNLWWAWNYEARNLFKSLDEKLYEEVLNDAEQTKPTVHPKIKVAAVREYSYKLARKNEMDLYDLSLQYDDMEIVRKMKEIVPEYKSRHSKYDVLDKK